MSTELSVVLISSLFSVLVAIITAFVSSTLYIRQVRADLQKEYASRFNERKWTVYTDFAKVVSEVFKEAKKGAIKNPDRYMSILHDIAASLWIVGSDRVIGAYIDWQEFTHNVAQGRKEDINFQSLRKLAQIVIEMRKDLGYINDRATADDLLSLYVTNIKEYPSN